MSISRTQIWLLSLAVLLGAIGGYWLKSTDMPRAEVVTAAPEVRQADGSVIAERQPLSKPTPAPHRLPKGASEERRVSLKVKPRQPDCEPVRVDLSLIREGDGRRVVASSPDGEIISALDMPIVAALMPAPARPWAAGGSYDPIQRRYGAWVERDIARLRVGADVVQTETGQLKAMVRVGWRF